MLLHGWIMWGAWAILGLLQVASLRYLSESKVFSLCNKRVKNFSMWLHAFNGLIILAATIWMSIVALKYYSMEWRWKQELHSSFGFTVLFATSFIVFIGFLAWYSMLYKGWLASYIRVLRIKWLHE